MKWFDCLSCWRKNLTVVEYNRKVAKEVQSHWPNNAIELIELIQERRTTDSKATDSGSGQESYDYVVFIDIAGDLDWICDDDHSVQKLSKETATLIARVRSIETMPYRQLEEREWMAFKRMLGAAIVSALEGSHDDARTLMLQAQTFLKDRTEEQSRRWMLVASTFLLLAFSLLLHFGFPSPVRVPMMFGLFGAYVSIVRRSGSRRTDAGAGKQFHFVEAMVRLVVGMLLGSVSVHVFSCSIAPELTRTLCGSDAGVRTAAFGAGLLDAFIPSMISTYFFKPLKTNRENND